MARSYFVLLARDDRAAPWRIEFGDYDRETVVAERDHYRESYQLLENGKRYKAGNLKIIKSNSARQSCIDYCVAELNKPTN